MSNPNASTTLYIIPADWQLPSKSVACIQLETYMRMARLPFNITSCTSANASPSGYLPAVEVGSTLLTPTPPPGTQPHTAPTTELLVATDIIRKLERGPTAQGPSTDTHSAPSALDGILSAAHRAQADAFAALLVARLQPATLYATWVESHAFRTYTRAAYGRDLPLPLSFIVPWGIRRAVLTHDFRGAYGKAVGDAVYGDAAMAYAAFAAQMDAVQGDYLFGEEPSSVDALLYGHLVYHLVSPVMPPELRDKLTSLPVLVRYVERITTKYYATSVPPRPESVLQAWQEYRREQEEEQGASGGPATGMAVDPRRRTTNWLWLGAAAALMLGFWSQQPHFPIVFLTYGGDEEVGQEELEELEEDDS